MDIDVLPTVLPTSRGRMRWATILPALSLLATLVVYAMPGSAAAVTGTVDGTKLTVTGDASSDSIAVVCVAGQTEINGVPAGIGCASLATLVVNGVGGSDDIDDSGVVGGSFPNLDQITLKGGAGNDDIRGGPLDETVLGGSGADEFLAPGGGNDDYAGGKDLDALSVTCNCDQTVTGTHLDASGLINVDMVSTERVTLISGGTADTLDATAWPGVADLRGGDGNDTLLGGIGDDQMNPGNGTDTVDGGKGDDTITAEETGPSADTYGGGPGTDLVYHGSLDTITSLSDSQMSGEGIDSLASIERAKLQRSTGGTLIAVGFTGDTELIGSWQNDTLIGGSGDDIIDGSGGVDLQMNGGPGHDTLAAHTTTGATLTSTQLTTSQGLEAAINFERARVSGTAGLGNYDFSAFSGPVYLSESSGDGSVTGNGMVTLEAMVDAPMTASNGAINAANRTITMSGVAKLVLNADAGGTFDTSSFDGPVWLRATDGDDAVTTGRGKDTILAGAGNDEIDAGRGRDRLYGHTGNDDLDGQAGTDGCNGGKGRNTLRSCERGIKEVPYK